MGVEGIGTSVVRKEDRRFITGKGRYVDDIKLVAMSFAHFIRSPHAHAKVKSIDTSEAMKMPGVIAVLNGQLLVDDKVGNLICGWAITSKDGSPMKMGAWPAMAPETVRFVGQAVAVVIAETKNQARDAAEAVVVNYEELPAIPDIKAAITPGTPQLHPEAPGNIVYDWHLGDEGAVKDAFAKAANMVTLELTNNRLVPNAMEPRAAIADYDTAEEHYSSIPPRRIRTSLASCCQRSTISRLSTSCASLRPMSAGVLAPRSISIPKKWSASGPRRKSAVR
jgi:aerobic carbon-monoxide dehydrogenase large subunit